MKCLLIIIKFTFYKNISKLEYLTIIKIIIVNLQLNNINN